MTTCSERQRSGRSIDHHLAASHAFWLERRWYTIAVWIPIAIAVVAPAATVVFTSEFIGAVVGAVAGVITLASRSLGQPKITSHHRRGVLEIEARDCVIFDMPWNDAMGDEPQRETTDRYARRTRMRHPEEEARASDWYELDPAVSEERNVLVSQRANVAWGENEHAHWANALSVVLVGVVALGLVMSMLQSTSLVTYLGIVAFPSVAGWIQLWDLQAAHRRASHDKAALRKRLDTLLKDLQSHDRRRAQDAICRARMDHPHVPNWFHEHSRDENDASMRAVARQLTK